MARPVVIRPNEAAVHAFIEPGGDVNDLLNKIIYSGRMFAKELAPARTGRLKANIRYAKAKADSPLTGSGYFYANIFYARYVEEGTVGPIRSTRGTTVDRHGNVGPAKMKFFATRGKRPGTFVYREEVKGQRAQHYMRNGLRMAMRVHT